jgi:hypothetical protein
MLLEGKNAVVYAAHPRMQGNLNLTIAKMRSLAEAINCAFDAGREGTTVLVEALNKGDEIKAELG